mgnify:CR=1 FL=1
MANDGTIMLTAEDGSEDAFFVWEKADIAGRQYLLVSNVAQEENEEADDEEISLILRAAEEENDSVLYDIVEDEEELRIISKYFEELLEDVELS